MEKDIENSKKCPYCVEIIQKDAKKCRYCGEWLDQSELAKVEKKKKLNRKKLAFIGLGLLTIILIWSIRQQFITYFNSSSQTLEQTQTTLPESLQKAVDRYLRLYENQDEQSLREIYRNYFTDDHPIKIRQTEDEYVQDLLESNEYLKSHGVNYREYKINEILTYGKVGYSDTTGIGCSDNNCTKKIVSKREISRYVLTDSGWKMAGEQNILCPRIEKHKMPDEFDRALNLILSRSPATKDWSLPNIINCIDVSYATTDDEMENAEGSFSFIPGQSLSRLEIKVSPRYQSKDDLITAVLLVHETFHAMAFVDTELGKASYTCFENEAYAFLNQNVFISFLNAEEQSSLFSRLAFGGSEELKSISNVWYGISKSYGKDDVEKAINYVKSIPYYQKQCAQSDNQSIY